ncbi:MAG: glycoside hydrolase family 3 C-terminal domain-containing protein [Prevotella sp.]|nr:glycoside hydrolase family 3 C-terminal domain-containing protein [Prevotella sp.]
MNKKIIISVLMAMGTIGVSAQMLPYQNPELSFEQRADDLLKRLTLDEKVKLMMDSSPAIERLGIPQFQWWNEALHGLGRNGFATVYPITMGMAASWNDALLEKVFTAVSDEARAKNTIAKRSGKINRYQSLSFWTPNINIFRDPRWGRGQETYGEDPYLTSKMGLAVVRGLQGPETTKYRKLYACAKHFAVHSGPEWNRHEFNINTLAPRDLWETYMPAFKALVQQGNVREVMCAYQRLDDEPCCGNNRLLNQILRDEWGFKHLVVSDCGAVSDFWVEGRHGVSRDAADASAKAVLSGTDVECGSNYKDLPTAIKRGEIKEEDIDRSVRRLLIGRFELGDFDPDELVEWTKIPESVVASKEHKQMALDMARQGTVLLQNKNNVLPLKKSDKIVVMGPNANDSVMMWGNYNGFPTHTVTILQGIEDKAGKAIKYVEGCGLTRGEVKQSRYSLIATPDGKKGMRATYWNNTKMEGEPVATQVLSDPISLSNGGATVFAPGVNLTDFSALYEGVFIPQEDETLTIYAGADDRMAVIINGDTITESVKGGHSMRYKNVNHKFKAGQKYEIEIHYVQEDNMATLNFDLYRQFTPTQEQLLAEISDAETVVFVGGISPKLEGEEMKVSDPGFKGGDRTNFDLPEVQRNMLKMLHDAGKKIVFVHCSGSAMALERESEYCDAILQAWYGGELGGEAIGEILYGDVNPSGKLPITFYKKSTDLPDFLDYSMKGRTYRYFQGEALYPFGHGLSYTTFQIGKPKYSNNKVFVPVTNSGNMDGDEVVQVYIKRIADSDGPIKTLKAYKRVTLKAGEKQTVEIDFPRESFEGWDEQTNTMRVVPGKYLLMVGNSSDAKVLQTITVKI